MMIDHWKVCEPIDQTPQLDAQGAGPIIDRIEVVANAHPSEMCSEQRIQLGIGKLAVVGLTREQSAALRAQLEQAEDAVAMAVPKPLPPVAVATEVEGVCESCCREIRNGELVHRYGMDVVHAGPCPVAAGRN